MQFLTAFYISGLIYFFCLFLKVFKEDIGLSEEEQRQSWIVLIIGTVFWPIVVPISCLEKGSIKHLFFSTSTQKKTEIEVLDINYPEFIPERASHASSAASTPKA